MVLARADPRDGPEMELRAPRCEGRAPRTIAENLSSSALPGSSYPDPPPNQSAVPPAPSTKAEQLASSSMTLSKQYEKPKEAAGKATPGNPSSKAAQNSSSVFGTPRQWESPTQTNGNARPQSANPSTKAEQNSSSLFGTPRTPHHRRAEQHSPCKCQHKGRSKCVQLLVSPQITLSPPDPPRQAIESQYKGGTERFDCFWNPRYVSPPPQPKQRPAGIPTSSFAQTHRQRSARHGIHHRPRLDLDPGGDRARRNGVAHATHDERQVHCRATAKCIIARHGGSRRSRHPSPGQPQRACAQHCRTATLIGLRISTVCLTTATTCGS